jgi:uncharacterized lipoprotein YmbA
VRRPTIALLCLLWLSGCASAPQESYYTLSATGQGAGAPIATLPDVSIAVSAASVNEAVDRPQLVTRVSETQVRILEQQRWAEPLRAGIPRVVAADLSRLLGTTKVWAYPQTPASDIAYRVTLDVQRFESRPGEGATIEVAWMVRRLPAGDAKTGRSVATERAGGAGFDALVAAHSRALDTVSRDIAQAVATLAR